MHPTAPHAFIHLAHDACIAMGVQAAARSCMTCIYSRIAIMAWSPIPVGPVLEYGSFSCGSMCAFVARVCCPTFVMALFCTRTLSYPPSPDGWRLDVFYAAIVWSRRCCLRHNQPLRGSPCSDLSYTRPVVRSPARIPNQIFWSWASTVDRLIMLLVWLSAPPGFRLVWRQRVLITAYCPPGMARKHPRCPNAIPYHCTWMYLKQFYHT